MHRLPTRPALALIALVFLSPSLAIAQPHREARAPAERAAAPSLFSKLRDLLTILWAETGSVLEPNGAAASGVSSGSGVEPNTAIAGDTGSVLEPNG